jgi:monofunctional glycosyltransferase
MKDDSLPEQPLKSSHRKLERSAIKPTRYRLRLAVGIASVILAALVVTTVVFRVINPISPIGVAEMFAAPSIKRAWLPLGKMSPDLPLAVIASEDGRFCNHWGVDWTAVRDAIKEGGGIGAGLRGASTIPMQLAKNLYLWPQRSYLRKALEVPLAYLISAFWRKEVVMETYLNIAPWGPVVGAEEASRYYFQKSAADLTRQEAILLATALPNPSVRNPANPSPRTLRIAQAVEKRMPILASRSECVLLEPGVHYDLGSCAQVSWLQDLRGLRGGPWLSPGVLLPARCFTSTVRRGWHHFTSD